jgi:hypothetical protein
VSRTWLAKTEDNALWEKACRDRWRGKWNEDKLLTYATGQSHAVRGLAATSKQPEAAQPQAAASTASAASASVNAKQQEAKSSDSEALRLYPALYWKNLYLQAECDGRRDYISLDELSDVKWRFQFHAGFIMSPDEGIYPSFGRDMSMAGSGYFFFSFFFF